MNKHKPTTNSANRPAFRNSSHSLIESHEFETVLRNLLRAQPPKNTRVYKYYLKKLKKYTNTMDSPAYLKRQKNKMRVNELKVIFEKKEMVIIFPINDMAQKALKGLKINSLNK